MTKLFVIGALFVTGFAFVNFLLGFMVTDVTDKKSSLVTTGASQHLTAQAPITTENQTNIPGRFPLYGTPEFSHKCPWASRNDERSGAAGCTILARPLSDANEGISNWISQIVAGHILAQQTGCSLLLDYGKGIDVSQVITPFSNRPGESSFHPINWTVPSNGFECEADPRCIVARIGYFYPKDLVPAEQVSGKQQHPLVPIPIYRHAYKMSRDYFSKRMNGFKDLTRAIPGFTVESGLPCSLGSLFQLAPSASAFEPRLFSTILPALNSRDTLVLSIYLRTGQMEGARQGLKSEALHLEQAEPVIKCALSLEKEQLLKHSRVVWMVVTDSSYLKKWITESYSDAREILTTRSRGAHTKPSRTPSTADFAEALIDWYLIGESDLVVTNDIAPTFGDTAALRTMRPYFKVQGSKHVCNKMVPVIQ